jgi:MinD-like ATPase involved in chromosome partitioning or flagellar assembly
VSTSQTVTAGDPLGLNILFTGTQSLPAAADIDIYDYVTGTKKATYKSVAIQDRKIHIGSPAVDSVLRAAGKYKITVSLDTGV